MSAFSEIVLDYVPPDPLLLAGPLQHRFFRTPFNHYTKYNDPTQPFYP